MAGERGILLGKNQILPVFEDIDAVSIRLPRVSASLEVLVGGAMEPHACQLSIFGVCYSKTHSVLILFAYYYSIFDESIKSS